jgi:hypothetical protein
VTIGRQKMNKEKERKNEKTQIWTRKFLLTVTNEGEKKDTELAVGGETKREIKNGRKSYKSFGDPKILT